MVSVGWESKLLHVGQLMEVPLNNILSVMTRSHLPQAPWDKWVYNFACDFWDIVGGYGLWRMCSHYVRASCYFSHRPSGWGGPRHSRTEAARMEIVLFQCCCCAASAWKSYRARVTSAWRWCSDRVASFFSSPKILLYLHNQCAVPCGDCAMPPTTCLRAYEFFTFI